MQALLFIYERHSVYTRLYQLVAPAQKTPGPGGQAGECALPAPRSDVETYLRHRCGVSTFCRMVVTIARLTDRGTKNFCPAPPDASQVCIRTRRQCNSGSSVVPVGRYSACGIACHK